MLNKRWMLILLLGVLLVSCGPQAPVTNPEADAQATTIAELQAQIEAAASGESEVDVDELQRQLEEAQAALEEAQQATEETEGEFETYTVEFKNPDTFTQLVIGEPETLDPAVAYDSASTHVLNQVYDRLVFYKEGSTEEFVPMLATDWEVSEDGLTYTFTLREGVTFHQGGTLEAHDVEYTFARNLLTGWDFLEMGGPMGLYFDPLFGTPGIGAEGDGGVGDLAGNDDVAICEMIKSAVVADDEAGTVTITLNYPASYFIQLIAAPWAGIQDMEWMVEQGAWDGDCNTWRDWYAQDVSTTTLYSVENGTGPYMLDHWTTGEELVLSANDNWWVTEPLWEGSTIDGVPDIETVVIRLTEEWGTRLAAFQAGDADTIDDDITFAAQIDPLVRDWNDYQAGTTETHNPGGILQLYTNLPATQTTDMFFNFNVNTEGGNPWIGSGQMDGRGVPPDFFSDIHVRKAFNYCFDRDTFINDIALGEAIPHRGPMLAGMPGYDENSFIYEFDLAKCEEEFKAAFDGELWEAGFTITLVYNSGNDSRRVANEILKTNIETVNPDFQVIIANLPWPTYLAERRAGRFPMHQTGWIQDFNHPHNWVVPYMSCHGDFSGSQAFPEEMCGPWDELMQQAVREDDPEAAAAMYAQLQQEAMDNAIDIFGYQPTSRDYLQLWIEGYYYNPAFGNGSPYFAALSKVQP